VVVRHAPASSAILDSITPRTSWYTRSSWSGDAKSVRITPPSTSITSMALSGRLRGTRRNMVKVEGESWKAEAERQTSLTRGIAETLLIAPRPGPRHHALIAPGASVEKHAADRLSCQYACGCRVCMWCGTYGEVLHGEICTDYAVCAMDSLDE
jgi:hypothetical protein